MRQRRNFREYIGPDSNDSDTGDDKIDIDMKRKAQNTAVTYLHAWRDYKKTTFAWFDGKLSEVQFSVPLTEILNFTVIPERCAILIHSDQQRLDTGGHTAFKAVIADMADMADWYLHSNGFRSSLEFEDTATVSQRHRMTVEEDLSLSQIRARDEVVRSALIMHTAGKKIHVDLDRAW